MTSEQKKSMEWDFGAEYWVPEDLMFKTAPECLEAFPEAGPACGVVSTSAYQELEQELEGLKRKPFYKTYDAVTKELAEVKALLKDHEDDWKRIQDAERALVEAKAEIERLMKDTNEILRSFQISCTTSNVLLPSLRSSKRVNHD